MRKEPKQLFIERHAGGDRVILVQINFKIPDFDDVLAEFIELAKSANVEIFQVVTGNRQVPTPKFFIGQGKAHEIATLVKTHKADAVLFNHDLSAAQGRNLEQLFNCRVLGRTELILDIFAQRAHSAEGKLQVELAQLQHLRTRLIRGWTHLERQKGGIGLRGPGETQLETDRRLIDVRIKALKKRLEKVSVQRNQRRRARQRAAIPTVSLVGYTNAGKSTLFNRITQANVYAADQLFATLDPTLRQIHLAPVGDIIVADTVGFIRDLPHDLIAAFRATLEETCKADLLLHVVDCSQPHYKQMIHDVDIVLQDIGAQDVPCILVFNKIDLQPEIVVRMENHQNGVPAAVWISAASDLGIPVLEEAIVMMLRDPVLHCKVILEMADSKLRTQLYDLGAVQSELVNEQGQYELVLEIRHIDCHRLLANKVVSYLG